MEPSDGQGMGGNARFVVSAVAWRTRSFLARCVMALQRKPASQGRSRAQKNKGGRSAASLDDLVRAGVERFVLKEASMMSFQKAIRAAAKKGLASAHPLTGAAFRRIVREAIREREVRRARVFRRRSKSGREKS